MKLSYIGYLLNKREQKTEAKLAEMMRKEAVAAVATELFTRNPGLESISCIRESMKFVEAMEKYIKEEE